MAFCLWSKRPKDSAVSLWIKFILFFPNCALFILALFLTGLTTWALIDKEKKVSRPVDFLLDPACVLCLGGSIAVVVSYCGAHGSLRENLGFVKAYRWLMTILLVGEVVAICIIFVLVYVEDAKVTLGLWPEKLFNGAIPQYRDDPDTQDIVDYFQEEIGCCGFSDSDEGYKDWNANPYFNCSQIPPGSETCSVPYSCCIEPQTKGNPVNYMCGATMLDPDTPDLIRTKAIYKTGCFKKIGDTLRHDYLVVAGVILGIVVPQMILIYLCRVFEDQIEEQMEKWSRSSRPTYIV